MRPSYVVLLLALSIGYAAEADYCSAPKNTQNVIECLNQQNLEMKKLESDTQAIEGILKSGTQIPNPTVEIENMQGKSIDGTAGGTRVAISQLIEIGGKRSARRASGEAKAEAFRAASMSLKDQILSENILRLVKYRQLVGEIAVLQEALGVYEKVNRQFSSRPKLSPDQQVNIGIFKLALGDYRHKLATLVSQKREVEAYFKVIPNFNLESAVLYLPKRLTKWPKLTNVDLDISKSPKIKEIESNLKKAQADLDLARANVWPDPTLSLIASNNVDGAYQYKSYGVAVSFPLPIFNLNGGERQQANAEKFRAEIDHRISKQSLEIQKKNLIENYAGFVAALENAPDPQDTEKKHRTTENLFYQGVISGTLVIEAHRQILEFTETQNELELETLQTLFQIYSMDGKMGDYRYE
ncbi:MAG: TolC family protein [Pseudobdellovibrionaceae bacterium]